MLELIRRTKMGSLKLEKTGMLQQYMEEFERTEKAKEGMGKRKAVGGKQRCGDRARFVRN